MVSEIQHEQWRRDIRSNIDHASKGDAVALEAAKITAQVMLAERLGQLSFSLNENSKIVSEQDDHIRRGRDLVKRLIRDIDNGDNLEMAKAMAEDWAEADPVDQ